MIHKFKFFKSEKIWIILKNHKAQKFLNYFNFFKKKISSFLYSLFFFLILP